MYFNNKYKLFQRPQLKSNFINEFLFHISRAIKLILSIWLIALGFAIPQALQFGVIQEPEVLCVVKQPLIEHSFEISTFLFFVAPMTLITVLYALIGLKLRSSAVMKRERHSSVSCRDNSKCSAENSEGIKRNCRHQHGKSSKRVLKMLGKKTFDFKY